MVANTSYHTTDSGKIAAAKFDGLLAQCVTDATKGKIAVESTSWYWSGQGDQTNNKIFRVKFTSNFTTGSARANGENLVRCIKDVENTGE